MRWLIYSSIALLVWLPGAAMSAETPKITAAVVDFSALNTSPGDASVVASFVRSAVVKSGVYAVVEESEMRKVLSVQSFQQSGCTDQACAVKLGRLLNAKKVITGSLSMLGTDRYLNVRLVNVETGEIEKDETSEAFQIGAAKRVAEEMSGRLLGVSNAKPGETASLSGETPVTTVVSTQEIASMSSRVGVFYFCGGIEKGVALAEKMSFLFRETSKYTVVLAGEGCKGVIRPLKRGCKPSIQCASSWGRKNGVRWIVQGKFDGRGNISAFVYDAIDEKQIWATNGTDKALWDLVNKIVAVIEKKPKAKEPKEGAIIAPMM